MHLSGPGVHRHRCEPLSTVCFAGVNLRKAAGNCLRWTAGDVFSMRRFLAIGSGLAIVALLVIVLLPRLQQAGFLDIKRAWMTESHVPSGIERIVSKAREVLHLASVDTRQGDHLAIGRGQMEWSLRNTRTKTGWLYFTQPGADDPLWEFAPCSRSNLTGLRPVDFDAEFVQKGDTDKITAAFDAASRLEGTARRPLSGRAIPVKEGQVVLARLIDAPRTVYAIKLFDQRGTEDWGSISVEYVEIELPQAER